MAMIQTTDPELVVPFGEELAVVLPAMMPGPGTIASTLTKTATKNGDTQDGSKDDPDPGPA